MECTFQNGYLCRMDKQTDILNAALKLFVEKGEQATSMKLISTEAKCGIGTMYNYFASKEELINKLYSKIVDELWAYVFENFDFTFSVKKRLLTAWSKIIDFGLKNPLKYKYIALFSDTSKIKNNSKDVSENMGNYMFKIYEEGKQQGIIKNYDTLQLIHFNNGAIMKNIINYPDMSEEYKNRLLILAWDAIKS